MNQDSHYAVIEHSTNTPAAPPPAELEPVQYATINIAGKTIHVCNIATCIYKMSQVMVHDDIIIPNTDVHACLQHTAVNCITSCKGKA